MDDIWRWDIWEVISVSGATGCGPSQQYEVRREARLTLLFCLCRAMTQRKALARHDSLILKIPASKMYEISFL